MADVRAELARLRPVYETGVLRMLLHRYSDVYVAVLRACFDPLTAEVPQERLLSAMARCVGELAADGDYRPREGEDERAAARRILRELKAEDEGDYAWIADSFDRRQHRWMCRLTQRAHRAIEALATLQQRTVSLSGAQVNSIIMEIEHARKQLTADVDERIALLEQEIAQRRRQIERLREEGIRDKPSGAQVSDIINVVHNTLRGVPVDLRELVIAERDNGDALRRQMDNGSMSGDEMLDFYHDEYDRTYRRSDEGRRFNDAFQIMFAPDGRAQLDEALADISSSPWLRDEGDELMTVVGRELDDIYEGIDAVRDQIRLTDESVGLLVRQQTDMRFRTMSRRLAGLFASLGDEARADERHDIGVGSISTPTLAVRARQTPARAQAPALAPEREPAGALDMRRVVAFGGPRIAHMVALVAAAPVIRDGLVDVPASFNRLPADERREGELVGFLSYLDGPDDASGGAGLWRCVGADGGERVWRTRDLLVPRAALDAILDA